MKPIKTIGKAIASPKNRNTSLAAETIEIVKEKRFTSRNGVVINIADSINYSVQNTVLYKDPLPKQDYPNIVPVLEVTNETTAQAAVRLKGLGKDNLVALNFAAARNPGGGFLAGANAQEEDLCRASSLYACLKSKPMFYNDNILCEDSFYTDNILYSPNVTFFRDEYNIVLEEPFYLSIISAPAPNVSSMKIPDLDEDPNDDFGSVLYATLLSRAMKVLQIAAAHGHKNIILGAWGCGAFGNDSQQVSVMFREALRKVPAFEFVSFPIYDTREPPHIYENFKKVIGYGVQKL